MLLALSVSRHDACVPPQDKAAESQILLKSLAIGVGFRSLTIATGRHFYCQKNFQSLQLFQEAGSGQVLVVGIEISHGPIHCVVQAIITLLDLVSGLGEIIVRFAKTIDEFFKVLSRSPVHSDYDRGEAIS